MSLGIKSNKTNINSVRGPVKFINFVTPVCLKKQPAFTIEVTDQDTGRKMSITLYGDEITQLQAELNQNKKLQ